MFKLIQQTIVSVLLLSSCTVSQNYVNSTTNSHNTTKSVDLSPSSEYTISQNQLPGISNAKHITCKTTGIKPVSKPKFDEAGIEHAKTEKDMIKLLLKHIEQLDKTIDVVNVNVDKINKQIKVDCK